jgi:hypothetical protein
MERYQSGEVQPQSLEKRPGERCGKWVERLLISIVNSTEDAKAEHSTEDEDRYGIDIWIKAKGHKDLIPVDLTLNTDPEVLEEKHRKALDLGCTVFEASQFQLSLRDFELAARGAVEYQEKVVRALVAAIQDWAGKLDKPFVTREELAKLISADEKRNKQFSRGKGYRRREAQVAGATI